jgi:hypothetical protein
VRARAFLATDAEGARPVTLEFRRGDGRWKLEQYGELATQLDQLADRLRRGVVK